MANDPYLVLGLTRSASEDDIRRRYRQLVKELHPDVNPSPAAEERFKQVASAFEILGDSAKRQAFDRGEIDGAGEARRGHARTHAGAGQGGARYNAGFSGFDSDDPFSDIFAGFRGAGAGSRTRRVRGADARYTIDLDLEEAALGAKKRVTLPGGDTLDLNVPAGVTEGQILRLKGKGNPGANGGERGDALVEIKIRPHVLFKRQGDDILYDCPVTLDEAVLGGKVEVPTLTGRVQVSIPKGTSSGRVLRLKGKGIANAQTGAAGDQLVNVRLVLPDTIDADLEGFLTQWRERHRYDPGRK